MEKQTFVFGKRNYIIMLIGMALIAIGYILMAGGGSEDPNIFNPEIFNTLRITVAPFLVVSGLLIEVYAIMGKK